MLTIYKMCAIDIYRDMTINFSLKLSFSNEYTPKTYKLKEREEKENAGNGSGCSNEG